MPQHSSSAQPRRHLILPLALLAIGAGVMSSTTGLTDSLLDPVFGRPARASAPSAARKPALVVTAAQPVTLDWPELIDATGPIAPWQEASVASQVAGLPLLQLDAAIGDSVRRGQELARFDDSSLLINRDQLRAALDQASALAAQAEANLARTQKIRNSGGVSEQEVLQASTLADTTRAQLASARAQLAACELQIERARVIAPDDGVITARSATLGMVGSAGTELFRLIRKGRLEWRGQLTASQIGRVRPGLPVSLQLPDGSSARATLRTLAPALDAQNRQLTVYADIIPGSQARAGMFASARIELPARPARVLPAASIVVRDGRSHVFVIEGPDAQAKVRLQAVGTLRRQGTRVEVSGLAEGLRVVEEGAGLLTDGDIVRVVRSRKEV